ncbi:hypothetical protein BDV95DRAFT_539138 [Massariosphaeria phaeospora]|uniref:WD40-repeat-containing domain protein n=1 Tax=Massariosphaeria phaeospora TaxID=100035 RepID=A0A7C8M8V0_9PLEO|nr:hypothetical protein BDV95DRAFT_539138 [Massariosphaeria phaeospora]
MENTEVSPQFKTTSLPIPSPSGTHVASLSGARLQIRCLASHDIIRSITLPSSHDLRTSRIAWSPPAAAHSSGASTPPRRRPTPRSHRILIADDENTRVYDLCDEKWNAVISNGSGGMGKNVHVEFGSMQDEVVVFSDFASKVTVWCLRTGRTVEIKDPKFSGREGRGWGYRPQQEEWQEGRGAVLALLCRTSGQDVLLLLAPRTYDVLTRVELPTTDAQGLKWSRDGRWIAVWDSAASGYRLCIYTADGHLYRTVTREPPSPTTDEEPHDYSVEGLGIKTVEWVPGNAWLALGGWDRRVRILSTRTFAPAVFLDHTAHIHVPSATVYTEHVDARGERTYAVTPQPMTPPKAAVEKNDAGGIKQGISIMAFNHDGTVCATRDDETPSTVWIWDLRRLRPTAILVQHAPVKGLQWHATDASFLLIQTTHDVPTVYLYNAPSLSAASISTSTSTSTSTATPAPPSILALASSLPKPASSLPTKYHTTFLPATLSAKKYHQKPAFLVAHSQAYIIVYPHGRNASIPHLDSEPEPEPEPEPSTADADQDPDGGGSDDSLYDILTGRTPVPRLHSSELDIGAGDSGLFEDTGVMQDDDYGDVGMEDDDDGASASLNVSLSSFEDTFREKRKGNRDRSSRGGTREKEKEKEKERGGSVFDESGMDEMF